jgi:tetratricopeptide (TPR) repeat protein
MARAVTGGEKMGKREPAARPSSDEVLAQLEAIAKSGVFKMRQGREPEQLTILRHVVSEELSGRTPTQRTILKWLGLEAPDADKDESRVRVQMGHIRKKLSRYYDRPRTDRAPVVIAIPVGTYTPTFTYSAMGGAWTYADTVDLGKAQSACDRQTLPSCAEALQHVSAVLARHADFAPAFALKADIHMIRAIQGMPPQSELDAALAAAERAVALSPDLWQGHNALGFFHSSSRNWRDAQKAFARARANTPADVPTHFAYIAYLVARGQLDEAIRLVKRDATISKGYYGHPTLANPVIRADLGFLQLLADDLEEATATLESTIRDAPSGFVNPYLFLALTFEAKGDPERAIAVLQTMPASQPPGVELGIAGLIHGLAGHVETAGAILDQLLAARASVYVPPFQIALVYLGLGEHRDALRCFRRAAADKDPLFHWMPYSPLLRHIAHWEDFHAFMNELGLKWRWRRMGSRALRRRSPGSPRRVSDLRG